MEDKKIVCLGANGQVASELLIELKKQNPEIETVGICRSPAGSVYLRYNNVPVIHASIEKDDFPVELLKTASMIVNTIYLRGKPAEIKKRHERIIEKIMSFAGDKTKIVHFSTVAAFHKSLYAEEKIDQEELLKKLARKYNRQLVLLRAGHVLGKNQGHSIAFVDLLKSAHNILCFPGKGNKEANCVSIKYLSKMLLDILSRELPGISNYSAVFNPTVNWADVFGLMGAKSIEAVPTDTKIKSRSVVNKLFNTIRSNQTLYDFSMRLVRNLPSMEQKIYAKHLLSRAQQDIGLIGNPHGIPPELAYLLWEGVPGERYPLLHRIQAEEILP